MYASPAGLVGCHCVAADAGLRPRAPIARNLSSRSSFALYSTYFLIHRHYRRPRIVRRVVRHDPRPVHPGGPVNDGSFRRAIGADKTAAATPASFLCASFLCASRKTKKIKNKKQKENIRPQAAKKRFRLLRFSRPIRASPPMKKDGSHARRDAGQGSWSRMYLTIRGRQRIFSARISGNAGQRGSQGDTSPCIVRGRSPQKAVTQ